MLLVIQNWEKSLFGRGGPDPEFLLSGPSLLFPTVLKGISTPETRVPSPGNPSHPARRRPADGSPLPGGSAALPGEAPAFSEDGAWHKTCKGLS